MFGERSIGSLESGISVEGRLGSGVAGRNPTDSGVPVCCERRGVSSVRWERRGVPPERSDHHLHNHRNISILNGNFSILNGNVSIIIIHISHPTYPPTVIIDEGSKKRYQRYQK